MRRSLHVSAPLLVAAALTLATGCERPEMQRCVDEQNMVVDDDLCHAIGEQRTIGGNPHKPPVYRYYYGGTGSPESGTTAEGGRFEPDPTHSYKIATSSVTVRNGFGNKYAPWIIGAAGLLLLWKVGE
jgi:hypothetical protein